MQLGLRPSPTPRPARLGEGATVYYYEGNGGATTAYWYCSENPVSPAHAAGSIVTR